MKKRAISITLFCALLVACVVPSWVSTVESIAEDAVPIAGSIVSIVDPAASPAVVLVEDGFNALVKTLDTYKASQTTTNLQAVVAAFNSVSANIQALESAAHVSNPNSQAEITAVVQLLTQAVTEIASQIPQAASAQLGLHFPGHTPVKGWKAKDFKNQYNELRKIHSDLPAIKFPK